MGTDVKDNKNCKPMFQFDMNDIYLKKWYVSVC